MRLLRVLPITALLWLCAAGATRPSARASIRGHEAPDPARHQRRTSWRSSMAAISLSPISTGAPQQRQAADDRRWRGVESGLLARWEDHRVQRAVRRQRGRLHRPGDRRRAGAADVASRCRQRAGLHAGRQVGVLHLAARDLHRPLRAALHGAGPGRDRRGAADPERRARDLLARRPAHRLQPDRAAVPAVEAVSRRHRLARLWLYNTKGHAIEKIPQPA